MKKYIAIYATVYSIMQVIYKVYTGECPSFYQGGLGYIPLILSTVPVCFAFTKKYRHTFNSLEFREILIGSIIVDLVWTIGAKYSVMLDVDAMPLVVASIMLTLLGMVIHALVLGLFYSDMITSLYIRNGRKRE